MSEERPDGGWWMVHIAWSRQYGRRAVPVPETVNVPPPTTVTATVSGEACTCSCACTRCRAPLTYYWRL